MYDFTTLIDRKHTGSAKWNQIEKEMGAESEDIIAMSVADMELPVAPEITEAIIKTANSRIYGYTSPTDSYYDAVLGWQERRHSWKAQKEWISLAAGIVSSFHTAVRALTQPGDKVVIQPPVYYPFAMAVKRNGCEIVNNPLILQDNRYVMDYDDLEEKTKDPKVKCMILCSPHNPVGRVWTKEELTRLGEICLKNNVVVISDEIHNDFIFTPYKHTVFANISKEFEQNSLILTAPSKTFNMAGLKASNIFIPNPQIKEKYDTATQNIASGGLNIFGLAACEAAYNKGERWLGELLEHLEGNKKYFNEFMASNLPQLPVTEAEGTYLLWFDCRSLGMDKIQLEKFMREKARVFFDEGYLFGDEGTGYERINIACPRSMLERVLNNIKNAIDKIF